MGAWDTGVFDNDNAADFSGTLENCSDVQARQDILMATMGEVLEEPYEDDALAGDFEFPYETEHALASAAYVADAKNGRHQFTDNSYAMMLVDKDRYMDDDAWEHIDIGTPTPELVQRAVVTVEKILGQMERVRVEEEWQTPSRDVLAALKE